MNTAQVQSKFIPATETPVGMPAVDLYWWTCDACQVAGTRATFDQGLAIRQAVAHNDRQHPTA